MCMKQCSNKMAETKRYVPLLCGAASFACRSSCRLWLMRKPCTLVFLYPVSGSVLIQPAFRISCSICLANRLLFSPCCSACSQIWAAGRQAATRWIRHADHQQ